MSWWTARSSTCVAPPCCGGQQRAFRSLPTSNIWRHFDRSWTQDARSVPWVSIRWRSQAYVARTYWTRSSLGLICAAATCTATMPGEGAEILRWRQSVRRESAPCAGRGAPMCHCGWAARRASTWMQGHLRTPSSHAVMSAQRRRQRIGVRSNCHTAPTLSTPPARSASNCWPEKAAASDSFSKVRWTRNLFYLIWALTNRREK